MSKKPRRWYEQSAVVPYREGGDGIEILLITTRRGQWIVPKGIVEQELGARMSARREALEEAGVAGDVDLPGLGEYTYKKWAGTCRVQVFSMRVTEEFSTWDEQDFRSREWVPLAVAIERVASLKLRSFLMNFAPPLKQG